MTNVGNIILWLSGIAVVAAIGLYAGGRSAAVMRMAKRAVYAHLGLLTLAFGLLLYYFLSGQYQYAYVSDHSARSLELFYKISALWAGQEGTFLLWALITAILATLVMRKGGEYLRWAMVYLLMTQAFLIVLMFVRSPFALVPGAAPTDGHGLNALLKDPWMVIHPPIVFIGYAAFVVPFAYVLAALTTKSYKALAALIFPWAAFATMTLGVGIFMGGFWAYKVLGWGGYWGWDPVENASLVPWLSGMALLHALILYRVKSSLPKTTMWLACISYILVIYGTFLTRSGVLADFSVHSFSDEGINSYLCAFLAVVTIVPFVLLLTRGRRVGGFPISKAISSREFALVIGVLLFCVAGTFILIGTSSPILTGIGGTPSNVTADYYNKVSLPIGILIALVLCFSPFLLVEKTQWGELFKAIIGAVVAASVVTAGAILFASVAPLHALLIFVSVAALVSNGLAIWRFSHGRPLRMAGYLSHAGFAVLLLGVIASAAYSGEQTLTLNRGESGTAYATTVTFAGAVSGNTPEDGYIDLRLVNGIDTTLAQAKLYTSDNSQQVMRTPYIDRRFFYDIYYSPLDHHVDAYAGNSIVLVKGMTSEYDDWHLTFLRFDMAPHGESQSMRIGALIRAERNGQSQEIVPTMEAGPQGKRSQQVEIPGTGLTFSLVGMSVEEKSVTIGIKDLASNTNNAGGESLVLSVSRKPLTGLVWFGCILISIGTVLSLWKRRLESKIVADAQMQTGTQITIAVSDSHLEEKACG